VSVGTADKDRTGSVRRTAGLAAIVSLSVLAGCGSSSSSTSTSTPTTSSAATPTTSSAAAPTSSSAQTLSLAANAEGQLKYDKSSLSAKAGAVSINFTNMSPVEHNVTVESSTHAVVGAIPTFQGATKTLSLNLKPGVYKFYCTVPGHRAAGMEGTLTVQ
jgi:plastocyanin